MEIHLANTDSLPFPNHIFTTSCQDNQYVEAGPIAWFIYLSKRQTQIEEYLLTVDKRHFFSQATKSQLIMNTKTDSTNDIELACLSRVFLNLCLILSPII